MPLPVGQIAVFAAVTVPYIVLLTLFGVPFNHNLFWLYVLPPGLATWLATRPVLESKRLPELVKSQLRYLAEPRILCRMAPLAERDVVVVTGKVWRPRAARGAAEARESGGRAERVKRAEQAVASAGQAEQAEPVEQAGASADTPAEISG